ncbi:hypothetical protein ACFLZM_03345 [Thermodesulfobacteriota bacterium]
MKKMHIISVLIVFLLTLSPALAADKPKEMDHSGHVGTKIHESTVKGYHLAYHVLDLPGRDVHHLMVYIIDPDERALTKAKVGYLIVGPRGVKQKKMAMAMNGSFGGDVNLNAKGNYIINMKALIGDVKVLDRFTHEVK